ncbi:carboxypeptidase-like regulatory domain-containing protein [Streptomyces spectabilis]|uniref:Carboxypeptidase regulatory-like domain-containing protein n=1 Tax=Streptomyces spectabilis TaxID=68270 RepID=A0A7W8APC8_STRST|nr:carboxypeptidase-like regulatory domain-containing protein [Streptomyces spectabilis]MBB5102108.1 hypothetical protein [Streptomyces spectabilis]MCI3907158.1 carboxypeptidase-like regulatory domain-containing protein [Streptomyces spectabilis]
MRIRTADGRLLGTVDGPTAYSGYLGPTAGAPGTWETFLIDRPTSWPVRSGDEMVLRAVDGTWRPLPDVLVRVDHGVLVLPRRSKKDPQLVTYQFGGRDRALLVSSPLQAGFPAYTPGDPRERTFTISGMTGGSPTPFGTPIKSGDQVRFSFATRNQARPERFWRLRDDASPRRVDGDAEPGGPAATSFTIEFNEVRPGLGWRPPLDAACRRCARVTAVVTRRGTGAPVADAQVTALPPSVPFAGDTRPAPTDGRAGLTASVDGAVRDRVPAGPIELRATANRFQTATVTDTVPDRGAVEVRIPMDCTTVTGRVLDSAGTPMSGEWVYVTDVQGGPILDLDGDPYQTRTDVEARFSFACVPHGQIKLSTDHDPSADRIVTVGSRGDHVELVVQRASATVVVRVVDADNADQPLDGAHVRLTVGGAARTATTGGSPPEATFLLVRPAGAATVRASTTGYLPSSVPATVPASGTVTVTVRLHRDESVQTPMAYVLQLDRGPLPRDLDLHCSGPTGGEGRFHCLFNDARPVPFARLDVDERGGAGPERITITPVAGAFVPGEYRCWIDNFSGEQTLAHSGASLSLLSVDAASLPTSRGRWAVADVPGEPGRLWYVLRFTLDERGGLTADPVMAYRSGSWDTAL